MKTSDKGIDFIKSWEKFSADAYPDAAGHPTIGYGHKIRKGEDFSDGMTEDRALQLLGADLHDAENGVMSCVDIQLEQNQFDALVSFVFNIGLGAQGVKDGLAHLALDGRPSHLLRYVNMRQFEPAAEEFLKWDHAGGVILAGLHVRRASEGQIFFHNIYTNHS